VILEEARRVGYLRIQVAEGGLANVSIALLPADQGRGIGTAALRTALHATQGEPGLKGWAATILSSNASSQRAFQSVGFLRAATVQGPREDVQVWQLAVEHWRELPH
jgi:RimJ/RimL family protein N-acetyltransferase